MKTESMPNVESNKVLSFMDAYTEQYIKIKNDHSENSLEKGVEYLDKLLKNIEKHIKGKETGNLSLLNDDYERFTTAELKSLEEKMNALLSGAQDELREKILLESRVATEQEIEKMAA